LQKIKGTGSKHARHVRTLPLEPYPGKGYQPAHAPNVENAPFPRDSVALDSFDPPILDDELIAPMGLGEIEGVEGVERVVDADHFDSVNHHQPPPPEFFSPPVPMFQPYHRY